MFTFTVSLLLALAPILYLWHVNQAMSGTPEEVKKITPNRWTEEEIRETYTRLEKEPIDFTPPLPPKLNRRYIVVGGSGKSQSRIVCLVDSTLRTG